MTFWVFLYEPLFGIIVKSIHALQRNQNQNQSIIHDTEFRKLLVHPQAGTLHVDGPPIYMNESSESDMVDEVYEANIVPVASAFSYYFALDVPAGMVFIAD